MGYGMLAARGYLRAADELALGPAPHHEHWLHVVPRGPRPVRGMGGDRPVPPDNTLAAVFHDKFVARYGEDPDAGPTPFPCWPGRHRPAFVEGLFRAPILSGPGGRKDSSRSGSSRRHRWDRTPTSQASPHEHGMFRGDRSFYGRAGRWSAGVRGHARTVGVTAGVDHTLRVVQWTTGRTGRAAVRAVLDHPELELAGCYA
ncbi:MAG: hypothetical protein R2695_12705 [Acidimicrobiales bacterium]